MTNFNGIALFYDAFKKLIFQNDLDKAAAYYINLLPPEGKICVVGGGSGAMLSHFLPTHQLHYVEQSEKMIVLAKKRTFKAEVYFYCQDALKFDPVIQFDAIITPFLLDFFDTTRLNQFFQRFDKKLKPQAIWLHADFYPQHRRHHNLVKLMYWFFRMTTGITVKELPDFDQFFKKYHYQEKNNVRFKDGLIQSKYYQRNG